MLDPEPTRAILVKRLQNGGSAHIIGVEHLSPTSAKLARQLILGKRPEAVILELDARRAQAYDIALPQETIPSINSVTTPRSLIVWYPNIAAFPGIMPMLFAYLAGSITSSLSELYVNNDDDNIGQGKQKYGAEVIASFEAALEVNANIVLGDRDINLTLQRASSEIDLLTLYSILPTALGGLHCAPMFTPSIAHVSCLIFAAVRRDWTGLADVLESISKESDEKNMAFSESSTGRALRSFNTSIISVLRRGEISVSGKKELGFILQRVLSALEASTELSALVPAAISTERDILLMNAIRWSKSPSVVAVVGSGHLDGIARYWAKQEEEEVRLGLIGNDAKSSAERSIAHLLKPPPFNALNDVGAPFGSALAVAFAARAIAKRSRVAFFAVAGTAVAGGALCGIVLQRVGEVRDRIRTALLYPTL